MLRRVLVPLVFGLVVAGGALATWHARGQALLVQDDLVTARELLARAGGFQAGKLAARRDLIDRAQAHAAAAEARLGRFPLRQRYAKAWATRRNAMDAKRLRAAVAGVEAQTGKLQRQVTALSGAAASDPVRSAELTRVQARLNTLVKLHDDIVRQQLFLGAPTGVVGRAVITQLSRPTPRALVLVLGLLIGLLTGVGLSLLLESARPSVLAPADVERATGVQVIASVPRSGMRGDLPVLKRPFSPAAEGYRRVAGALERRGLGADVRVVAIAAADPGEGTSLLSANLAHSLARQGRDVVLVSADLRHPTLDGLVNLDGESGLAEWLQDGGGDTPLPLRVVVDHLLFLPAGSTNRNPGELLTADRLRQGLRPLAEAGYIVLVDTPPALWSAEAMTLAAMADATLLVARARTSRWRAIEQLAEGLRRDGVREIGIVLLGDRRRAASRSLRRAYGLGHGGRHQSGARAEPKDHPAAADPASKHPAANGDATEQIPDWFGPLAGRPRIVPDEVDADRPAVTRTSAPGSRQPTRDR